MTIYRISSLLLLALLGGCVNTGADNASAWKHADYNYSVQAVPQAPAAALDNPLISNYR